MRRVYVGLGAMLLGLGGAGCAYGTDPGYPMSDISSDAGDGGVSLPTPESSGISVADAGPLNATTVDSVPLSTFSPENGWATDYMVLIDPTFGSQDQEVIIQALGVWMSAVPVRFSIWVSPCDTSASGQICIHNGADWTDGGGPGQDIANVLGYTAWSNDQADVYIYCTYSTYWGTDDIPDAFWEVVLHEVGHAQGLIHHTGYYVMDPCANCGPMPFTLTADDANQWLTLRGFPTIPEDAGLPAPQDPVIIPGTGQ